mmetsp:Transcript_9435/g.28386  ORF Transcript_9435/g.28386 Transcript_9435/m.28386 type:complete len:211 (+) Transcript_9435:2186-2818(+)
MPIVMPAMAPDERVLPPPLPPVMLPTSLEGGTGLASSVVTNAWVALASREMTVAFEKVADMGKPRVLVRLRIPLYVDAHSCAIVWLANRTPPSVLLVMNLLKGGMTCVQRSTLIRCVAAESCRSLLAIRRAEPLRSGAACAACQSEKFMSPIGTLALLAESNRLCRNTICLSNVKGVRFCPVISIVLRTSAVSTSVELIGKPASVRVLLI